VKTDVRGVHTTLCKAGGGHTSGLVDSTEFLRTPTSGCRGQSGRDHEELHYKLEGSVHGAKRKSEEAAHHRVSTEVTFQTETLEDFDELFTEFRR